jgi:putative component of toxin-antitoxin plasmid stabilization module
MFEIRRTEVFDAWLAALRDETARALIAERINRLGSTNMSAMQKLLRRE